MQNKQEMIDVLTWVAQVDAPQRVSRMRFDGLGSVRRQLERSALPELLANPELTINDIPIEDLNRVYHLLEGDTSGPSKLIYKLRPLLREAKTWEQLKDCFLLCRWLEEAYSTLSPGASNDTLEQTMILRDTTQDLLTEVVTKMSTSFKAESKSMILSFNSKTSLLEERQDPYKDATLERVPLEEGSVLILTMRQAPNAVKDVFPIGLERIYMQTADRIQANNRNLTAYLGAFRAEDIPRDYLNLIPGSYFVLKASEETTDEFLNTVATLAEMNILEISQSTYIQWERHWPLALEKAIKAARKL